MQFYNAKQWYLAWRKKVQRKWNNSCKVIHKHEGKNKTKTEKTFISQIYISKYPIFFKFMHFQTLIAAYLSTLNFTFKWPRKPTSVGTLFNIRQKNKCCFMDITIKLITFQWQVNGSSQNIIFDTLNLMML